MSIDPNTLSSTEQEIYWEGYGVGYEDCDKEARLNLSQQLLAVKRLGTKKSVDKFVDTFISNMRK